MNRRNQDIRLYAMNRNVRFWEIAERMGKSETTLYRLLRKQLSDSQKQEFIDMIDCIAEEGY